MGRSATPAFPILRPGEVELRNAAPEPATIARAVKLFRTHGCLQLDGVLDVGLVHRLRRAYLSRYRDYFVEKDHPDALRVGPKRFMITVRVEPPFHTPALYANPFVFPILEAVLGPNLVLNSFGSVASLPGDPAQEIHRDHPALFDDPVVDIFIPSVAVTVIVPLVELNETNGTTRMLEGSHRLVDERAIERPAFDPIVNLGSCMLMDYRLVHGGTANRSSQVRPIFYVVYSRPWFLDVVNFYKQKPVVMSEARYRRTPTRWKGLFARATFVAD